MRKRVRTKKPFNPLWLLTSPCEVCGRHARASNLVAFWTARPEPTTEDALVMSVESTGHHGIRNKSAPLWPFLALAPTETRRVLVNFYERLEQRLLVAAKNARITAERIRIMDTE